jgi:hypothetical protein
MVELEHNQVMIFWISTECAHDILIKISERGNGIGNSWLDLLKSIVSRSLKMAKKFKLSLKVSRSS